MRYLLDTCTFIWLVSEPRGLSKAALAAIEDGDSVCFLSVISSWEIITKNRLGKLDIDTQGQTLDKFLHDRRFSHELDALGIDEQTVRHLVNLPDIHRDPFDRMLICQAIEHQLVLVTPDPHIQRYPIKTLW